ncbi:hypothetical protein ACFE04_024077 [Oxalis oulophora]
MSGLLESDDIFRLGPLSRANSGKSGIVKGNGGELKAIVAINGKGSKFAGEIKKTQVGKTNLLGPGGKKRKLELTGSYPISELIDGEKQKLMESLLSEEDPTLVANDILKVQSELNDLPITTGFDTKMLGSLQVMGVVTIFRLIKGTRNLYQL